MGLMKDTTKYSQDVAAAKYNPEFWKKYWWVAALIFFGIIGAYLIMFLLK